jgi:ubiquinone/menaquinone biosynthesis C-methylase UbiE
MILSRTARTLVVLSAAAAAGMWPTASASQLASRPAEEWLKTLDRPERVAGLKIDEIVARLGIKPADVVADLGAGSGVFVPALARAVGPTGAVYAVDIEQGLVDHIARRAKEAGLANAHAVLGAFTDPKLPRRDLDLALFHDVLHHVQDRAGYLRALASYMAPGGRIAVVELDVTHPRTPHKADSSLHVTKDALAGWMKAIGFAKLQEFDLFEDKWFVIYGRAAGR